MTGVQTCALPIFISAPCGWVASISGNRDVSGLAPLSRGVTLYKCGFCHSVNSFSNISIAPEKHIIEIKIPTTIESIRCKVFDNFLIITTFFELEIDKECFASKCGTKLGINCHYYNYISKAAREIYGC